MLTLTLTIGIAVSLVISEFFGLLAGGIVVPGYVAMLLDRPKALAGLVVLTAVTWGIVRSMANVLMLFGSRRFAVTILVGIVISTGANSFLVDPEFALLEWSGLGYIVPGLIAHHCERQGVVATTLAIAIAAPLTAILSKLAANFLN